MCSAELGGKHHLSIRVFCLLFVVGLFRFRESISCNPTSLFAYVAMHTLEDPLHVVK